MTPIDAQIIGWRKVTLKEKATNYPSCPMSRLGR